MSGILLLLTMFASEDPGMNWPGFRGDGAGRSKARDLPLHWSEKENIAWTAPLPGHGQSSPVVWRKTVFVTSVSGPEKDQLHVLAFDLARGSLRWRKDFAGSQKIKNTDYVSKAAPTPAVDAERLYAFFESGDLVALNHAGAVVWQRSLVKEYGLFQGNHGVGASVVLTDDAVVVLVDHAGPSYLLAADKRTGKTLWKNERAAAVDWSSPITIRRGARTEILVSAPGRLEAFDGTTGAEAWKLDGIKGNTVPSPSPGEGLLLIGSQDVASNFAVKIDPTAKSAAVVWRAAGASSSFGSPLAHAGAAYYVNRSGTVYCLRLSDGAQQWTLRLTNGCWASPVGAGDRVYFFARDGITAVVRSGMKLDKLAENSLPVEGANDRLYGVAAVDGAWLLRTGSKLTCVGKPAQ